MTRLLRHLLLALVLLFSQQAAQLHAVDHLAGDLGLASNGKGAPAGHPAEHCLAFHAIDSALPGMAMPDFARCEAATALVVTALPLPFAPRVFFNPRAPPVLS